MDLHFIENKTMNKEKTYNHAVTSLNDKFSKVNKLQDKVKELKDKYEEMVNNSKFLYYQFRFKSG